MKKHQKMEHTGTCDSKERSSSAGYNTPHGNHSPWEGTDKARRHPKRAAKADELPGRVSLRQLHRLKKVPWRYPPEKGTNKKGTDNTELLGEPFEPKPSSLKARTRCREKRKEGRLQTRSTEQKKGKIVKSPAPGGGLRRQIQIGSKELINTIIAPCSEEGNQTMGIED